MSVSVDSATSRGKAPLWARILIPLLIIALGLGILLYPVVATQWNNARQSEVARQYSDLNQQEDPRALNGMLDEARAYNAHRVGGPILDPWLGRVAEDNVEYQEYLQTLDHQSAMARLVVPTANADLPIYHGTSNDVLDKGVGHLYGSHLPVGGEGTHSVLTAHTGLSEATLFDNLTEVGIGDAFYVSVAGEQLKYEVDSIDVVLPDETDALAPRVGDDLMTLITCTPYGINTHRLLVTGHRVPMDPATESEVFDGTGLTWQWWMYALLAAAVLVLLLVIFWIRTMLRKSAAPAPGNIQGETR